ncbi:hypothetical protein BSU04_19295 [Caballeronia sordidicola]|uniref:Uncharacterized protein n=1 Tax=Caballeronia sordidicola TaxID=196367 RepID=A0A226X154_CABSO|nr:hypothetical protein BSU04_19295 [Caballeronia sordidicola]
MRQYGNGGSASSIRTRDARPARLSTSGEGVNSSSVGPYVSLKLFTRTSGFFGMPRARLARFA